MSLYLTLRISMRNDFNFGLFLPKIVKMMNMTKKIRQIERIQCLLRKDTNLERNRRKNRENEMA